MSSNQGTISFYATPIVIMGLFCGISIGVLTNLLNSVVCSDYYIYLMGWNGNSPVKTILGQGAVEGGALGLFFGVVIAISAAASTRLRCDTAFAFRTFGVCIIIVIAAWIAGGILGVVMSFMMPSLWNGSFFIQVPAWIDLHRFAWVGGSINGAYFGTFVATIIAPVHLYMRWKTEKTDVRGFAVLPVETHSG